MIENQGVWKIREIESTQPALPYNYTCFADGIHLKYLFGVQIPRFFYKIKKLVLLKWHSKNHICKGGWIFVQTTAV